MTMRKIEMDVSIDLFDKVMFFLENLPKNKIRLSTRDISPTNKTPDKDKGSLFGDFLRSSRKTDSVAITSRDELHER